jgi:hypothetical protein
LVTGAESPLQLSYKKAPLQTAICGSELTIALIATSAGEFDDFLTAAPLSYYCVVQNSTNGGSTWNNYWNGVNTTDTYSQAHSNAPYPCLLKFNCGLGELQWHRYENAGALTSGLETILEVVNNCMTFLPFPNLQIVEIINVREDTMSDNAGLLEQLYINDQYITEIGDDGETHGWNCNKLLNAILTSINCRIYQSDGLWFIERIYERINTSVTDFVYQTYSTWQTGNDWKRGGTWPAGVQNNSVPLIRTINNASYPKITNTSERGVTQLQPILVYKFNTQNINNLQLIPNPFLEDTPLNKDANGRPKRWDASAGVPFTCAAGGTALTFGSSAIAGQYYFGQQLPIYVGGSIIYRKVLSVSGSVVNLFTNIDSITTSAVIAGIQTIGGDQLETIDPYEYDVRYQSGYSFGNNVTNDQTTYINNNFPLFLSNVPTNFVGSPFSVHAVRKTGDTYTNPYVFLDPDNGSLAMNIRSYVKYTFTTGYTSKPSYGQCVADAMYIMNSTPGIVLMCQMFFKQLVGDGVHPTGYVLYYSGQLAGAAWNPNPQVTLDTTYNFSFLNSNFPYQTGVGGKYSGPMNGGLTLPVLCNLLSNSVVGTHTVPFDICFDTTNTWGPLLNTATNTPFSSAPQAYAFDFRAFPVFSIPPTNKPSNIKVSASVSDYAIRAVDIQYKDNAQSVTSNLSFYSSAAGDTRWNELIINAAFGDTDTKGYPASFSVSSGVNTGTWHTRTLTDTGTPLADIFFKKFAQIPGQYRSNLRGNNILDSSLQYYHSIEDEDGIIYMQLGHTFEIKQNKFTTDMEQMADAGLTITTATSLGTTSKVNTVQISTTAKHITPLVSPVNVTPIKMQSGISSVANPGYPQ